MHPENLEKLSEYLATQGMEAALLTNPFNVTWLSGYAPGIQTGPSPFEGGPALGWFYRGQLTLLVSDWEAGAAAAAGVNVSSYVGYVIDSPLDPVEAMEAALRSMLAPYNRLKGTVGVEFNGLPAALLPVLQAALPNASLRNLGRLLDPLRAVKTPDEIEKIRAALRLADLAQETLRAHLQPGVSELELWQAVKGRVELAAGCRVPVLVDLVAGKRTAEIGGAPLGNPIRSGDGVLLDFVPRLEGYWGDNCAVWFVGEPSQEMRRIYTVVADALRAGAEAIRPGISGQELDGLVRTFIREAGYEPYPHHTGHGLGTSYHEEPRIVPYQPMELQAGMVIVLEPGIYLPGVGGVRLEDAYLVTPNGCEVLTRHLQSRLEF